MEPPFKIQKVESTNLLDLPPELIIHIVQRLSSFKEVLSLKQVCKRLYSILSQFWALQHLVVSHSEGSLPTYRKWFSSYDPVNCQFLLTADNLGLLETNSILLSSLRQLFIYEHELSVKQINFFLRLEHLEFEEATLTIDQKVLSLPNLCFLKLAYYSAFDGLILDTPKLQTLATSSINFQLRHPQSVSTCYLKSFDTEIKLMSNLKYLYCELICETCGDLIVQMPSLLEIHTIYDQGLLSLIDKLRNSPGTHPSIYSHGLLMELATFDFQRANSFPKLSDRLRNLHILQLLKLVERNLHEVPPVLPFVRKLRFSSHQKGLNLPSGVAKKIPNLEQLTVGRISNTDQLASFLAECSTWTNLRAVTFEKMLRDSFFEKLPHLLPNLCELTINENLGRLYFFLYFRGNLQSIVLRQKLSYSFVSMLLYKNRALAKLQFVEESIEVTIQKQCHDRFLMKVGIHSRCFKLSSLLQCVKHLSSFLKKEREGNWTSFLPTEGSL